MSLRQLNFLLLIAFFATLSLNWSLSRDWAQPNSDFLPGMAEPVSYGAFSSNPNFPDGKTLQAPVSGTIPHGNMPMHFGSTPEEAVRAGKELHNPLDPRDPQVRQRGAVVFANYCQVCHGPQGQGNGPVSQRGVPPPPTLREGKSKDMKDGQLFHVLTYGQANMASYAAQISPDDRWRVIVFLRSLQQSSPAAGEKKP